MTRLGDMGLRKVPKKTSMSTKEGSAAAVDESWWSEGRRAVVNTIGRIARRVSEVQISSEVPEVFRIIGNSLTLSPRTWILERKIRRKPSHFLFGPPIRIYRISYERN